MLSPSVDRATLAQASAGLEAFALDLYRALRDRPGNLFFSPYSLSLALAMTYAGARGDTERQMATTLHYTLPQDQLHPALNALDLALVPPDAQPQDFVLRTANATWGQEGYPFLPEYLDLLDRNYGAGLRTLDFADAGHREQARLTINRWVSDRTAGKITELLQPGILTEFTRLVLTNAIYFQGDWQDPFSRERTKAAPFTLLNGQQVMTTTMYRRVTDTPYAEDADYQAVELPYQGGRIRMVIIVPRNDRFQAVEQELDAPYLNALLQALHPVNAVLAMPKFKYEVKYKLEETLADMGMPDAFDAEKADFSGMTGGRDLMISHVVHQAIVAVDEKGTEAAAASAVMAEPTAAPPVIRIDRPFIFLIRDADTEVILFLGRVLDPRS